MNLLSHYSLLSHNTFGVDARCETFATVASVDELRMLLGRSDIFSNGLTILGEGSNVLFTDDVAGLVLRINIQGREVVRQTDEEIWLRVGAGESWQAFVKYCVDRNWGGIENLAGIPGSAGGAPVQNIGAYGVEVAEVLQGVEALELPSGRAVSFKGSECGCGYRSSIFKREWKSRAVVTHLTLALCTHPRLRLGYAALDEEIEKTGRRDCTIQDVFDAVLRIRREKLPDPAKIGNAGSFFKNPELPADQVAALQERFPRLVAFPAGAGRMKLSAGCMIELLGWRGRRHGHCGVHERQALVLVNYGGASGREIFQLSEEIRRSVLDTFGVNLEREVVLVGGREGD
jgi:UDP-N-acetylmuramate dehydrogenase